MSSCTITSKVKSILFQIFTSLLRLLLQDCSRIHSKKIKKYLTLALMRTILNYTFFGFLGHCEVSDSDLKKMTEKFLSYLL